MQDIDMGAIGVMDMGFGMDTGADGSAWRGDHTFHAGAAIYSFNHFIIPEIQDQHPEWTSQQVHEVGVQELTLRLFQDRVKDQQEKDRKPEMVTQWEITETAPGVYEFTTEYGSGRTSLRELWEHTYQIANDKSNPATYNPAAYNDQEAKAQLAMQEALVTGKATSFVSVLSHPDNIRYASVWEKTNDGAIISKTIDIGLIAGRDLSMEEATTLIRHLAGFNKEKGKEISESGANYPHVMVTHGTIHSEEIKTLVRAQTHFSANNIETSYAMRSSIQVDVVAATTKTVHDAAHAVVRESAISGRAIVSEIQRRINNNLVQQKDNSHKPLFLQLLEGTVDRKNIFPSIMSIAQRQPVVVGGKKDIPLQKKSEIKKIDKKSPLSAEIKISAPSAMQDIGRTEGRHKEVRKKRKQQTEIFTLKVAKLERYKEAKKNKRLKKETKRLHKEFIKNRKETKRQSRTYERIIKSSQLMKKDGLKMDSKERNRSQRVIHKTERKIWHILQKLAKKQEMSMTQESRLRKPKRLGERKIFLIERPAARNQKKKKEAIFRVSFAWTLWLLLKLSASREQPKLTGQMKHVDISNTKEVKQKGLIQKESAQWVLLAIIWYLAMIRESGGRNAPKAKVKKKKKNYQSVQLIDLPPAGIIFAFAPGNS